MALDEQDKADLAALRGATEMLGRQIAGLSTALNLVGTLQDRAASAEERARSSRDDATDSHAVIRGEVQTMVANVRSRAGMLSLILTLLILLSLAGTSLVGYFYVRSVTGYRHAVYEMCLDRNAQLAQLPRQKRGVDCSRLH